MFSLPPQFLEEIKDEAEKIKKSKEYSTLTPPSIIISSSYPRARAYVLFPLGNNKDVLKKMEDYKELVGMKSYYDVVKLRLRTLGMRKDVVLKRHQYREEDIRLLGMAKKVEEVEGEVRKVFMPGKLMGKRYAPFIPLMNVDNIKYGEVKINKHVEKVYYDVDWKAEEGLRYLYSKGVGEYELSRYFSLGVMGTKSERRFVPTKWSITAVDDLLAKQMYTRVREYESIESNHYLRGELFMNLYHIFLLPGKWEFELIELCYGSGNINQDYEGFWGRKDYAKETTGGYYAVRKEVLEYLTKTKKQAKVLVVREIEKSYKSLGVWVVREGVKKALSSSPQKNINIKEKINNINNTASHRMQKRIDLWKISRVLRGLGQRRLV